MFLGGKLCSEWIYRDACRFISFHVASFDSPLAKVVCSEALAYFFFDKFSS